jgi:hypothetical protein
MGGAFSSSSTAANRMELHPFAIDRAVRDLKNGLYHGTGTETGTRRCRFVNWRPPPYDAGKPKHLWVFVRLKTCKLWSEDRLLTVLQMVFN